MIPVAVVFRRGDYDDREIIAGVLGYNEIRVRMITLKLGVRTLELGKWVQEELRRRDVSLTEVLEQADILGGALIKCERGKSGVLREHFDIREED